DNLSLRQVQLGFSGNPGVSLHTRRLVGIWSALLTAGIAGAAPVVLQARESFAVPLVDGGVGASYGFDPLPGEAIALLPPVAVGMPGIINSYDYLPLIQLGGPDAGKVIGQLNVVNGPLNYVPRPFFWETPASCPATLWLMGSDIQLVRPDRTSLTIFEDQDPQVLFGDGLATTTSTGHIRVPGMTLMGYDETVGWAAVGHPRY